jgi:hypothetical protein
MGVVLSDTSPVLRVHFRAVNISIRDVFQIGYVDGPDVHTLGPYCDPSDGGRECAMEAQHPHTQDPCEMERMPRRLLCRSWDG